MTSLAPIRGWVFVRSGHPLASRPGVTLTDLLDFPFAQVVMLPPRLLKPMLAARRPQAGGPALPFPALECATVRLAIGAVAIGSPWHHVQFDALMKARAAYAAIKARFRDRPAT